MKRFVVVSLLTALCAGCATAPPGSSGSLVPAAAGAGMVFGGPLGALAGAGMMAVQEAHHQHTANVVRTEMAQIVAQQRNIWRGMCDAGRDPSLDPQTQELYRATARQEGARYGVTCDE